MSSPADANHLADMRATEIANDLLPERRCLIRHALAVHTPTLTVHVGRFQAKTMQCRTCGSAWTRYEEKESDVSLGVRLVEDAAMGRYDVALLLTADSDMLPAGRAARRLAQVPG